MLPLILLFVSIAVEDELGIVGPLPRWPPPRCLPMGVPLLLEGPIAVAAAALEGPRGDAARCAAVAVASLLAYEGAKESPPLPPREVVVIVAALVFENEAPSQRRQEGQTSCRFIRSRSLRNRCLAIVTASSSSRESCSRRLSSYFSSSSDVTDIFLVLFFFFSFSC